MLTRYRVTVDDFDGEGRTLLRGVASGITLLIRPELLESLDRGQLPRSLDASTRGLLERHFLVPSAEEDVRRAVAGIRRKIATRDVLSITLMTTSACNMACRYCFQNELFPRNRHLQSARGETLVRWTTALADRLRPRTFVLHLYGGEPLLNFERVEPAIVALRAGMLRRGIAWQMSLTTNGTLLTRAVAERLSWLGCRVAIISLDGPRAVQNHRRPLRNGGDSFDAVLEGMRNALRRFDVLARVNVDRENAAAAGDLLQELRDSAIAAHPRFFVSLEAVGPILHPTPHVAAHTMSSAESGAVMAGLLDRQRSLGIRIFGNMPSEISCEHIMQSALTVDQDGRVYPCPGFAGFSDFCLGDIDGALGEVRQQELSSIRPWEQEPCLSCPYLPQCQGGCKSCAVIVGKGSALENYHRTYCRRPFLDATFPPFLKAMYARSSPFAARSPGAMRSC